MAVAILAQHVERNWSADYKKFTYELVCLAAGISTRFWDKKSSKVFYRFKNKYLIEYTLDAFLKDKKCLNILITLNNADFLKYEKYLKNLSAKIHVVIGGETRSASSFMALQKVNSEYVMIHDGARIYIDNKTINKLIKTFIRNNYQSTILSVTSTDCLKKVGADWIVKETINRDEIHQIQTPQVFNTKILLEAYKLFFINPEQLAYDDAYIIEKYTNQKVHLCEGNIKNKKITFKNDLVK